MFSELLAKRAAENNPSRVGIIGAGLITQVISMQGIEVSAVADINLDSAKRAYVTNCISPEAIQVTRTVQEMNQMIQNGKPAITEDGLLVARTDLLDVVVEATGIPEVGARLAYETITHHKHLIMVNVEADVTVGPFLRRLADNAGVVYSLVDGDQPGMTMNIVEWAKTLSLEIVAAGRGTVFYDNAMTEQVHQTRLPSALASTRKCLSDVRSILKCLTLSGMDQRLKLKCVLWPI